ncbi:MAG TPA: rhomboid family intramembrane serine protease [Kofleriaceae bacterium]|nr:rhomboid family intramembrane serine protease [Kofleriaceae bacterium]
MAFIVEPRMPPVTARLLALTLGLSLAAAIDARMGGNLYHHLALVPEDVWRGQIWRLATWPFVLGGPLGLIFTCSALYVFGSDLAVAWGSRRYLRTLALVVGGAGAGTCVLGLVLPGVSWMPYLGGMALADAITIGWARQFPHQRVHIYLLTVRGESLVNVVVAVTGIFAVYFGFTWMLPELLVVAAALVVTDRSVRRRWLTWRLARVRRHLSVVRGEPADDP